MALVGVFSMPDRSQAECGGGENGLGLDSEGEILSSQKPKVSGDGYGIRVLEVEAAAQATLRKTQIVWYQHPKLIVNAEH